MIVVGAFALAIPAGASAGPIDGAYSSVNSITGAPDDSGRPVGGSDYSSVNAVTPPASEPSSPSGSGGSPNVDPGYSSLNAVTGPSHEPTFVSGSPSAGDQFDWGDAALGAGAALALVSLGGAALLTVRRRTALPSASRS
jgi:hypothetical protein